MSPKSSVLSSDLLLMSALAAGTLATLEACEYCVLSGSWWAAVAGTLAIWVISRLGTELSLFGSVNGSFRRILNANTSPRNQNVRQCADKRICLPLPQLANC